MISRLRRLWNITAVRLSIIYSVVFGLLAVALVGYMVGSTIKVLRSQFEQSIEQEIAELRIVYRNGGLNDMIRAMEFRASAPGANLYIIADASGRILAGNVRDIDARVLAEEGWTRRPFRYARFADFEDGEHEAIAKVYRLPNGLRTLIGRDIGEREDFQEIVGRTLKLALGLMVLLGILTWAFVGRRALKRIDLVSKSTDRILSGDRDERLPVSGGGDEFDRLSTGLNQMLDRIDALDQGLKQVSDNIAHDLKTPLTRLRNKAESGLLAEEQDHQRIFEELVHECDGLIKTFNALLMISRVESGSTAAELSNVDLSQIVSDICELYEPVADEGGYTLNSTIAPGLTIRGNRELLSQALSNLIDNAVKYGQPEDERKALLEVLLSGDGETVRLSVADNGPGIPPQDRERVMERFSRLEASRNKPGNGLGLSLVEAVAKLHRGRVELKDNQPGLCVVMHLPRSK